MKTLILFLLSLSLLSCSKNNLNINIMTSKNPIAKPTQTYLALGDSYTIGESVPTSSSFPFQLQAALNLAGKPTAIPQIIAKTGWTTGELKAATQEKNIKQSFDLVTLLIGVNNQYRGLSIDAYRLEFKELLQMAIAFAGGDVKKVYVLSVPDFGVTPFAQGRDRAEIAQQIDAFNAVNKEETLKLGVAYVDITPGSRLAATDLSLLAEDGLHPSGKMYAEWVKQLLPVIN
jgi:lysophospholipase L1-like esterase